MTLFLEEIVPCIITFVVLGGLGWWTWKLFSESV
jgi:hypothetical protein